MSVDSFPSFWKAEHDFTGDPAGAQLSFKKGDTFLMLEKHDSGWFTAERNRERGYVPGNYFTKIEITTPTVPPPAPTRNNRSLTTNKPIQKLTAMQHTSAPVFDIPDRSKQNDIPNARPRTATTGPLGQQNVQRKLSPTGRPIPGKVRPPLPASIPSQFKPNEAAAPPIPLRTDLGEVEPEPEVIQVDESVNVALLKADNIFLRYPKRGKPQKRVIALDDTLTKIMWREVDKVKFEGSLDINDVIGTKKGHTTKKLAKTANLAIALSVICSDENKTLELDAETPDLRNEWLINFQLLLRQNANTRLTNSSS